MKMNLLFALMLLAFTVGAQNSGSIPMYGEAISLENAKKVFTAAEAFATDKKWTVAIAIVDIGGNLVLFEKIDNTQVGSIEVAIAKAKTANNFKRATKVFEDAAAAGGAGVRVLAIPGAVPLEGGEPIYWNGKIVGAIGVSGMQSSQDSEVVKAGLAALK